MRLLCSLSLVLLLSPEPKRLVASASGRQCTVPILGQGYGTGKEAVARTGQGQSRGKGKGRGRREQGEGQGQGSMHIAVEVL